jgi:LysR family cys regulon transcriptional activator
MEERGLLRIAATHLHARHAVLRAVTEFKPTYPLVDVEIWQRNPQGVIDLVASGESHVGVATLPSTLPEDVVTLAAYRVERCVITPLGHPLLAQKRITLQDVAKYPMVAYDRSFVSGRAVQAEFERHGLQPRQVLKATGADVVKAAVAAGLGIAVFQSAAIDPNEDKRLGVIEARHLFPGSEAHVILRRGQFLRRFTYAFIARVAPQLTPAVIDKAVGAR